MFHEISERGYRPRETWISVKLQRVINVLSLLPSTHVHKHRPCMCFIMGLKKVIIHIYPDSRPKVFLEIMEWNTEVESVRMSIKQHLLVHKAEFPGIWVVKFCHWIFKGYATSNVLCQFGVSYLIAGTF